MNYAGQRNDFNKNVRRKSVIGRPSSKDKVKSVFTPCRRWMSLQVSLKHELLLQKKKQQSVHPSQSCTEKLKITLTFKSVHVTHLCSLLKLQHSSIFLTAGIPLTQQNTTRTKFLTIQIFFSYRYFYSWNVYKTMLQQLLRSPSFFIFQANTPVSKRERTI